MLCSIYKSPKRNETYLYIEKPGDFSKVPEALLDTFGKPELVFTMKLNENRKLAGADIQKVMFDLLEAGFYLQIPKPEENMLDIHLAMLKAEEALSGEQEEREINQLTGD